MLSAKVPEPEFLSSRLVPDLFDLKKLEEGETIRVLDLGPANSATFSFLNRFNCRLRVIDIREKLLRLRSELKENPELAPEAVGQRLEDAFTLRADERFDVCLMWDFLNYVDLQRLAHFAEFMLPHLAPRARLHGFAALNKNTPLTTQNYGIVDVEVLSITHQQSVDLPYRHSQSTLKDALTGLTVKQSILRADGRLEMILTPA